MHHRRYPSINGSQIVSSIREGGKCEVYYEKASKEYGHNATLSITGPNGN